MMERLLFWDFDNSPCGVAQPTYLGRVFHFVGGGGIG